MRRIKTRTRSRSRSTSRSRGPSEPITTGNLEKRHGNAYNSSNIFDRHAGKLDGSSAIGAAADDLGRHRLNVVDKASGIKFLVDTGADILLLPRRYVKGAANPTVTQLFAVNEVPIKTYGERLLTLVGLRRPLRWAFCVTEVNTPIIRADLLYHYNLSVNLKRRCLQDGVTGIDAKG